MTMEQHINVSIQNDEEHALVKGEDLDKLTILTVYDLKRLLEQYGKYFGLAALGNGSRAIFSACDARSRGRASVETVVFR